MSNNYPMRGGKNTLWEGGTRGVAAVRGPRVAKGIISYAKMHATDWLPTLLHYASGDPDYLKHHTPAGEPPFELGDGQDVMATLEKGEEVREELLLECHKDTDQDQVHGNALIMGDWKVVKLGSVHPSMEAGWHPPPGQDVNKMHYQLPCSIKEQPGEPPKDECVHDFCLFNVSADPCEYHNLATKHPEVAQRLTKRLTAFQATAVPPLEPEGCTPVITQGAWRPCDSPNPNGTVVPV